jgi:hypothetical protein
MWPSRPRSVARDAAGRWRHPARFHRTRPDLTPTGTSRPSAHSDSRRCPSRPTPMQPPVNWERDSELKVSPESSSVDGAEPGAVLPGPGDQTKSGPGPIRAVATGAHDDCIIDRPLTASRYGSPVHGCGRPWASRNHDRHTAQRASEPGRTGLRTQQGTRDHGSVGWRNTGRSGLNSDSGSRPACNCSASPESCPPFSRRRAASGSTHQTYMSGWLLP